MRAPAVEGRPFIPLTGADCFLRAFDAEIRRCNAAGHVSQLVLRLGPGFDASLFRELIERAAAAQPMLRAPIGRRFGVGAPVYRIGRSHGCPAPRVEEHDVAEGGGGVPEIFFRRLNEPLDSTRGELLRFDLVRRGDGGTDLAMSWLHMLLDGSGSERLVRWLDACGRGERRLEEPVSPHEFHGPAAWPGLRERGDQAQAWQRWLESFGAHPPSSLAGPLRRVRQDLRYDVMGLEPEQTARVVAAAGEKAGFLTPMLFYMAASIRAHHAVARSRGAVPESYVVPLAVNLRPRGVEGAVFRTHVSLLWFQVRPDRVEDFDGLIAVLREQRLAAIKSGRVDQAVYAMDFTRFAPNRLYTHMARRGFRGELCSFFFAFTGEFLSGLESFLGAELRDGFHVAPVPPSPGSCIALSLRGGRLNVTHVRQRGVFSEAERDLFRARLRSDLLLPG